MPQAIPLITFYTSGVQANKATSEEALALHSALEARAASGPRPPPPQPGDDSARHEEESRKVNQDLRNEYKKHLVRHRTSGLFLDLSTSG